MKHSSNLRWADITVQQFLDIYRLSINTDLDNMGKLELAVCILFDKTQKQVDEMTMAEFSKLSAQCAFVLNEQIPGKAARTIRVGNKHYSIIYAPQKLRHRQYVEVLHFGDKPIENMHLIMASIVEPVTWYGRRLRNTADDHEAIASDMLQARVIDVYHSAIFFCNLYINLMHNIRDYLEEQLMKENRARTKQEAKEMLTILINAMAGSIPQSNLQILKT